MFGSVARFGSEEVIEDFTVGEHADTGIKDLVYILETARQDLGRCRDGTFIVESGERRVESREWCGVRKPCA